MKKVFLIIALTVFSFSTFSQSLGDTIICNDSVKMKVKVLYFHITHRCNTCKSIEANVRTTLFDNFQSEIDSGYIGLSIVNCELPENAELVKKYDAYGATLAVTTYKTTVEQNTEDLTDWAFQNTHSPDDFVTGLKVKIAELLKQ